MNSIHKYNPNIHNNDGWTALLFTSLNGHYPVVDLEIQLKKGADPNIHDNDGWTALIIACQLEWSSINRLCSLRLSLNCTCMCAYI